MTDDVRNIFTALSAVPEPWQPHRLASVNDYDVKVVKLDGEFVWHSHPDTDELFLVLSGRLTIQLRDRDVHLGPHDVFVVPRGVEHCPLDDGEDHGVWAGLLPLSVRAGAPVSSDLSAGTPVAPSVEVLAARLA